MATKTEAEDTAEMMRKVQDLKSKVAETAHRIVHHTMPTKVLYLNELYTNNKSFNLAIETIRERSNIETLNVGASDETTRSKKRKLNDETDDGRSAAYSEAEIPANPVIMDMLGILKKEILELIEVINTVKIWIQLNIPRIEDGNNFGVSIQEETVSELGRAEDSGFAVLESMTKYFITRAKLVSKVIKYPNVKDYRQSVVELDEKEFINLRLCALDLRNNYAILHDMIVKNLEKLKQPRTSHRENLML
eukprot:TRINITY_DN6125_c0_g1_i1.p1 TRINITY_DN6125_c0_g1~~TRINITY_DN6125_c0_g1_i1.p1  ORF type:complete len:249 (+),score=56.87 TRINITY_DN6125_c0_g1_i1:119-865(+)